MTYVDEKSSNGIVQGSQESGYPTVAETFENDPEIESEILIDCCCKTLATAMGDRYDELVLGRTSDGKYIVDVYVKDFMTPETHKLHYVTEKAKIDAYNYIEENGLEKYKDFKGFSLCGGDYIVKFKTESGDYIRLDSSNMPDGSTAVLQGLGMLLSSHLTLN